MKELLLAFAQPIATILLMLLCAFGGWKLNTYYTGYQDSINQKIEKQVSDGLSRIEQQGAKNLNDTLLELKNRKVEIVTKEVPKFIDRPVYQNVCIDEDGVTTLQNLKNASTSARQEKK